MTEIVWKGPEQLREYLVPVATLVRHPRNPRRGKVDLIAQSLDRFGQVRPILVHEGVIVAGNHTFAAVGQLGWTHVAAVPNEFTDADEAKAYLLADNRLPELGTYDRAELIELLGEVEAAGTWAGTGYDADDLDDLRALHGSMPELPVQPFSGDYAATAEELAARAARLAAGNNYSELVLTVTAEQDAEFETHLKILRKEYGSDDAIAEIVYQACENQAALA